MPAWSQREKFFVVALLGMTGVGTVPMTFIRAPYIASVSDAHRGSIPDGALFHSKVMF